MSEPKLKQVYDYYLHISNLSYFLREGKSRNVFTYQDKLDRSGNVPYDASFSVLINNQWYHSVTNDYQQGQGAIFTLPLFKEDVDVTKLDNGKIILSVYLTTVFYGFKFNFIATKCFFTSSVSSQDSNL
jgi:hypothetical protein